MSRYDASIHVSDWLNFTWRALVTADRFEVSVRFQQGAFFSECTERWYGPRAGEGGPAWRARLWRGLAPRGSRQRAGASRTAAARPARDADGSAATP